MEARTNYSAVGMMVIILSTLLVAFALWLSVGFNQKKYSTYLVYINEAASGLSEESPVKFNGVQVGFVKSIELDEKDPRRVILRLNIEDGTPITTSTSATLISLGITGTSYVGLSASTNSLTPLIALPGARYPVIPSKPSLFNQFDQVLKEVSQHIDTISVEIQKVFDNQNINNFKEILKNTEKISKTLANNEAAIQTSIQDANIILKKLSIAAENFPEISEALQKNLSALQETLKQSTATMQAGKQAIQTFQYQTLPPATQVLRKLDNISSNLEKVTNKMRQNPAVILRGSTAPKNGPGE